MVTRREALQGMAGLAAAAMLPDSVWGSTITKDTAFRSAGAQTVPSNIQDFSGGWLFHRGDAPGAEAPSFDDLIWRVLDVPHDWSIEDLPDANDSANDAVWAMGAYSFRTGPFDLYASEGQSATGWTVGGVGWYRKTFEKPLLADGGKVELRFEGVYVNCDVWLNGVHLGSHPYGYTEFEFDLTPHLREGRNTVTVQVKNTGQNSRWYSGSGIFRKVWLRVVGPLHIPPYGVWSRCPEVDKESAQIEVEVTVENTSSLQMSATIRVQISDATNAKVGHGESVLDVAAGGKAAATCTIHLTKPRLWSTESPYLYRADVVVASGQKDVDAASLRIGLRKVEIDALHGLRINGELVKLRGGCVHHDNGPLGSVSIARAEWRRVEILKANGYNAIRTSHNPPSRDFLDACDQLGMLVIDEAFDCWEAGNKNPQDYHLYFKEWWQRDLENMILRDRNRPCVLLWSIGNEIHERAEPHGLELGQLLAAQAHGLDPTRKVTAAICAPWDYPGKKWQDMQPAFSYLDVAGYNYEWEEYEKDHAQYPSRIIVGTESFPSQAYRNWQAVEKNDWVIGDFVWTAIDYLGESGLGHSRIKQISSGAITQSFPWFNAYCGDIDMIGNKKPQSYFRDVVWRRSKVEMAVQRPVPQHWTEQRSGWGWNDELRSWTWPHLEGVPLTIRVYTRGDKVSLILNGNEVGSKLLTDKDGLVAEFSVPYAPGDLKAVAYEAGKEIGTVSLTTAGKPQRLVLEPDRKTITASRDDLNYVTVRVVDEVGRLIPDAVVPVSFSVSGPVEIAAVGSGNPKDVASFRKPLHKTYHGVCLAVLRPTGDRGTIELKADAPGIEGCSLQLRIIHSSNN